MSHCNIAAILRNEIGWFEEDENSSTGIVARLGSDTTYVKSAIGERLSVLLQNSALLLLSCVISLYLSTRMALVMMATFPLFVLAAVCQVSLSRCC